MQITACVGDGTCAETRFRLSAKRTSPFKSAGASVQSTTGSRGVRISSSNARYTMFRGSVKDTGYSLHWPVSPSLTLPCVTACHHISTGLWVQTQRYTRWTIGDPFSTDIWQTQVAAARISHVEMWNESQWQHKRKKKFLLIACYWSKTPIPLFLRPQLQTTATVRLYRPSVCLIFAWPCIIDINNINNQLDATITVY